MQFPARLWLCATWEYCFATIAARAYIYCKRRSFAGSLLEGMSALFLFFSWCCKQVLLVLSLWICTSWASSSLCRLNDLSIANRVYLIKLQWNPPIESQAIWYVARLGQQRTVTFLRHIMRKIIENLYVYKMKRLVYWWSRRMCKTDDFGSLGPPTVVSLIYEKTGISKNL